MKKTKSPARSRPLAFGTYCSGIGAPERAWSKLGWTPLFASEIDPFASSVIAHHYPHTPNLGDMEKISGETLDRYRPDVVFAGTPCQSFSVAGLRAGMADPRGNLALILLRLLDRQRPRWVVWENVPGVLTSGADSDTGRVAGSDFQSFLSGLVRWNVPIPDGGWRNSGVINPAPVPGAYGVAWRVLDAQHFGVPQRRRRVFVVGHLGDWRGAAAVLLERHSLSGNPPPGRQAGPGVAGRSAGVTGAGGERDRGGVGPIAAEVAPTLNAAFGSKLGLDNQHVDSGCGLFVGHPSEPDVAPALTPGARRASGQRSAEQLVVSSLTTRPYADGDCRDPGLVADPITVGSTSSGRYRNDADTAGNLIPVAFDWQSGGSHPTRPPTMNVSTENTGTLSSTRTPAIAYQQHGSNVGPMGTLRRGDGSVQSGVPFVATPIFATDGQSNAAFADDIALSLNASREQPYIAQPIAFVVNAAESCAVQDHAREADVSRCLDSTGGFAASQGGTVVAQPIPIYMRQASRGETMTNNRAPDVASGGAPGTGIGNAGDQCPSLTSGHTPTVAFGWNKSPSQTIRVDETTEPLQASPNSNPAIAYSFPAEFSNQNVNEGVTGTLHAHSHAVAYTVGGSAERAGGASETDTAGCLRTRPPGLIDGSSTTVVSSPVAYNIIGGGQHSSSHAYPTETSGCLQHKGLAASGNEAGTLVGQPIPFDTTQVTSPHDRSNPQPNGPCHTLSSQAHPPSIVGEAGGQMMVRRLLPVEAERLQAFPDGYTRIPGVKSWRKVDEGETPEELVAAGLEVKQGKNGKWRVRDPDGPRYKALGNSMCVNVMEWIGRRIQMVDDLIRELGEGKR